jgi:hypothetical protein
MKRKEVEEVKEVKGGRNAGTFEWKLVDHGDPTPSFGLRVRKLLEGQEMG